DTLLLEVQYPTSNTQLTKVLYNGMQLTPVVSDSVYRMLFYKLPKTMPPNERANLTIEVFAETKGFSNHMETEVLNNGSFFNNSI
ncbi:hypothetical protein J9332_43270, partial [Aquimarina celericrescens]|nr:hypothetical protein [Aquimarina celericrescens]